MIILILFAFLGGLVTILSPCILPVLPIVLSGSITGGKKRPLGVVTGFVLSFTFFTLFLSAIVKATGLSADSLRLISVIVILYFGITLLIPKLQIASEKLFSRLAGSAQTGNTKEGFGSGVLVGISLGLLWTPCVGPILASIITLAATSTVGLSAVIITLAYALGTAIPLLAITRGGRQLLTTHPWLLTNTQKIQKAFGVLMIITAVAIFFSWDRKFQTYILSTFPQYGTGLTKLEDNDLVKNQLESLTKGETEVNTAPELITGGQWLNSEPLTLSSLKGKVVLIDFWTYTCINCIRTLPYLQKWWGKYEDDGLVIIGVHTPEFEFEKNPDNVRQAIQDFGLAYPIMQDNNFATWDAYNNRYWPAKYLVDKNGNIRYTHFGEGAYDETETWIQELLAESGATVDETINNPNYRVQTNTPETYLGYWRMEGLVSPEGIVRDRVTNFSLPQTIRTNTFALGGTWTIEYKYSKPQRGSTLEFHFDSKEVFLVMRPSEVEAAGGIKIYLDGQLVPQEFAGEDVINGNVKINSDRLYRLINLPNAGRHILKLEVLDGDIELYAFTFG